MCRFRELYRCLKWGTDPRQPLQRTSAKEARPPAPGIRRMPQIVLVGVQGGFTIPNRLGAFPRTILHTV
jgi:hypothetical protein